MNNGEAHFAKKDKLLERDMADMIEYVRMITDQIIELRQRTRAAEQVINQLRKSGETSVEALLDTLFVLRRKQDKLDKELNDITSIVQSKEALIKVKEDEKSALQAQINDEAKMYAQQFEKLRIQLKDQTALMASQRKLLNELQVLNEFTQSDVTKASRDLAKVIGDRETILMQINEEEQATVKIKSRH